MNGFSPPYRIITWPCDVSFIARTLERHARTHDRLSFPPFPLPLALSPSPSLSTSSRAYRHVWHERGGGGRIEVSQIAVSLGQSRQGEEGGEIWRVKFTQHT